MLVDYCPNCGILGDARIPCKCKEDDDAFCEAVEYLLTPLPTSPTTN